MAAQTAQHALQDLYKIVDAGEKGFATAAASISDPALKIVFKLYAQQRAAFKTEIQAALTGLGSGSGHFYSLPGAVHRGRIAILAGMSANRTGQEKVVLKEAALGERVAVRTYQSALEKDLPDPIRAMVQRQLAAVQQVSDQMRCLLEDDRHRAAVRLAASQSDTDQAVQSLLNSGFAADEIETTPLNDQLLYRGRGATLFETVLSGAVGGALWGSLTGALAGLGVVQTTSLSGPNAVLITWLLTILGFLLVGALISSALAFFIGLNAASEDHDLAQPLRETAKALVLTRACVMSE